MSIVEERYSKWLNHENLAPQYKPVLEAMDAEEKNDAFDKMKDLNTNKNKEEELENLIESSYKLKSFIKIKNNQVKVVISGSEHDTTLANNIMNTIQEKFETKMYVTVQFSA